LTNAGGGTLSFTNDDHRRQRRFNGVVHQHDHLHRCCSGTGCTIAVTFARQLPALYQQR
jgi:hypothetical protein